MPIAPLGPVALSLLAKRHPVKRPAVAKATLEELLAKAKTPCHAAAIAFERAFGVLSFPDYGEGRGWRKSGVPPWLVGAAECLSSDLTFRGPGKRKLVPVLYTTNDYAAYLAEDGVAWGEDTVGDMELSVLAPNARSMMTRILFGAHVFYCPETKKIELADARGAEVAKLLRLPAVAEASDAAERWWSDGTTSVVEKTRTRGARSTIVARAPRGRLPKLGIDDPKPNRAPAGPVTFDSVAGEYAAICIVSKIPAVFDVACRALFEEAQQPRGSGLDRAEGRAISLAGNKLSGVITTVDAAQQQGTLRIRLSLAGDAYAKKQSRVESSSETFRTSR